jgi:cysteinyl-tRNA synthetase
MAALIHALERNGHTYVSDGSIYFRISSFPAYGQLAHLDHEGIKPGARIDADNYSKEDARDFVLWKATKPGEPTWDLVNPPGRPGWHLECSAMALRLLGEPPIDIHAGGIDLVFPHHENEIAQSEGATLKPFSRFWVHVEYLLVDDQKMSKSLGNTYTVPDIIARGYRPSAVRYLLLSGHYRKQLNFTWASLHQAEEALRRLTDFLARLDNVPPRGEASDEVAARLQDAQQAFADALGNDLNTSGALGAVFELVRAVNSAIDAGQVGKRDAATIRDALEAFDRVLGVLSLRRAEDAHPPVAVEEIEQLIEERAAARRRHDFAEADRIRDDLAVRGVLLEDSATGTRWKRR